MGGIILGILGILLLILVAALLMPVRARFTYDQGELALWVRYGPLRFQIFPPKAKPAAQEEPAPQTGEKEAAATGEETPKKKKKTKKTKKREKTKKPKRKINRAQIFYSLETLPPILGRALRRTGRRIRIRPLKIHLLLACADPADTAQLYGRLQAALSAGLPVLHRAVRVEDQDIQMFPDFAGDRMDCIADIGVSLRPWDVVSVGLRAGGSALKWFLGFRKLASPPEQPAPEHDAKEETNSEAA